MSDFEEKIRLRLTSNANDFDGIVVDMLKEAERWKRSNDVASQLFNQTRVDNERLSARIKELELDFGLMKIAKNNAENLLATCESALASRDARVKELLSAPTNQSVHITYQQIAIDKFKSRIKELEHTMYSVAAGIAKEVGADNIDVFQYERLYSLIQELKKGAKSQGYTKHD